MPEKFSIEDIEKAFARGGARIMKESFEDTKDLELSLMLGKLFSKLIAKSICILTDKKEG